MTPGVLAAALSAAVALLLAWPGHPGVRGRQVGTGAGGPGDGRRPRREPPGDRVPAGPRWAGAGSLAVAGALLLGGAAGAAVGVGLGVATWTVLGRLEPPGARRRRERLEADLPHVVDLVAACLAGGQPPGPAIEQVARAVGGPAGEELVAATARLRIGGDPVEVWRELGRHPQLGPLGRCLARAAEGGASVSAAMGRLAEDVRSTARARAEARARAVGVKAAVPLGLCLLPAFVLVGVVPLVAASVTALLR